MIFIGKLLWFWTVMGTLVSLTFWGRSLARTENRRKFTDEAIRHKMTHNEHDPLKLRLAEIFGSRHGVVILVFLCWPIALYVMLFSDRKT